MGPLKHFVKASQMEGFAMVLSALYTRFAKRLDHWLENLFWVALVNNQLRVVADV